MSLKEARLARLKEHEGFRFIKADLADRTAVEATFAEEKPERVIHLAAQAGVRYSLDHPHAYINSNLTGFLHMLEGCRHHGVEHLVYASIQLGLRRQPQAALRRERSPSIIR